MATTYKVKNTKNGSIVTEYWDNEAIRKYSYSVNYHGGNIIEFMTNNERYQRSQKTNFSALNRWLSLN